MYAMGTESNAYLEPVPMRTMLVGSFPAKSTSAVVDQVGFTKPVVGATVREVWTNPENVVKDEQTM